MSVQLVAHGVALGSTYALIGLGFGLIFGTARFFHLAHGAVFALGAYVAYWLFVVQSWPFPLAVMTSVLVCMAVGGGMELWVFRTLRARKAPSLVLLLASLGMFTALESSLALAFGEQTRTYGIVRLPGSLDLGSLRLAGGQVVAIAGSIALFVFAHSFLRWNSLGITLRAVADDRELAGATGLPVDSFMLIAMAVGSGMGAFGGIIYALDYDLNPTMGFYGLLYGVAAVIVGGVGSLRGALIGAWLLGIAQATATALLPASWQEAVVFGAVLAFLVVRPRGLFGSASLI